MRLFFETYEDQMNHFQKKLNEFPWADKNSYSYWLAQTFYFVRESTRLLLLAGANLDQQWQEHHIRFIEHAKEEKGHEKLLQMDLEALGTSVERIGELPETAAFYQTQYYWIEHMHPLAFFGYIILLEGLAAKFGKEVYEKTQKFHGAKASLFVKVHGHEDLDHIKKAFAELEALPSDILNLVTKNFLNSSNLYSLILEQSAKRGQRTGKKSAA